MNRAVSTMGGLGLGASLMYFLDPERGRRRRALVKDKMASLAAHSPDVLDKAARDFGNRIAGLAAQSRSGVTERGEDIRDDVLVARVRSKIGRYVSHPHAVDVSAQRGRVTLRGPILAHEIDSLLDAVRSIRGVREVIDRLEPHTDRSKIPSLQGGRARPGERPEILQENWTPALRVLGGTAGCGLILYGLRRRGLPGTAATLSGAGLCTRAVTNKYLTRVLGVTGGRRAVDIQKTIHLNAPIEEVYRFWTNYRNFPRFMAHIKEVRDLGDGRSHWVAEALVGRTVAWDAEITEKVKNQMLAWKTLPGSAIQHAGIVRFDPTPDSGTRIQIRLSYNPPAGAVGHLFASLFHRDPKSEMDEDLVRLKSLIEVGKTSTDEGTVWREEVGAPRGERRW